MTELPRKSMSLGSCNLLPMLMVSLRLRVTALCLGTAQCKNSAACSRKYSQACLGCVCLFFFFLWIKVKPFLKTSEKLQLCLSRALLILVWYNLLTQVCEFRTWMTGKSCLEKGL